MAGTPDFEGFPVTLRPPTERGRLYPRYLNSINTLVFESTVERRAPYGFTIDATLTLDIDAERLLAYVELMLPPKHWKKLKPFPDKPSRLRQADLVFAEEAVNRRWVDVPLEVRARPGNERVLITFGPARVGSRGVELSKACIALVDHGRLHGFYLSLRWGDPKARPLP